MGLDVELIDVAYPGTTASGAQYVPVAAVGDARFRFAGVVERAQRGDTTPLVERIDLYGVLVLRSEDMPQFLGELGQLLAATVDQRERVVMEAVAGLAERCRRDHDLCLRFVGD